MSGSKEDLQELNVPRFKRYPAYKDSGIEWLGEIPAHWELKKWRYCCRITEGQVPPDDDRYRDRVMIAPNHIESGTGRILFIETAEEQGAISGKYLVKPGDLIYSKIRPALNKACIAAGEWLCSADMYPVKVTEKNLRTQYLLYFVLSEPFVRLMVDESMRVAMPKVNRETLVGCPVLVPSLREQDCIATFLDRETAKIDALVATKERLLELLEEQRAAMISQAVTKGLDNNVPLNPSGLDWLGDVPAHWNVKQLQWAITLQRGHDLPADERELGDVPVVSSAGVSSSHSRAAAKAPGIVTGRYGTLGRFHLITVDYWPLNTTLYSVDLHSNDPRFLRYMLTHMSPLFLLNGAKSAVPGIDRNDIHPIHTAIPPVSEQVAIANFLDTRSASIDALVAEVRRAILRIAELRAALISSAVAGQIDLRQEAI